MLYFCMLEASLWRKWLLSPAPPPPQPLFLTVLEGRFRGRKKGPSIDQIISRGFKSIYVLASFIIS